ncbi:MAG TPA: DUF4129 domain-containing protein, partial [Gaiellaceae bacterium]|nr:DUF4129 domain-containing protein [Gaiellaceae bacterium]
IASTGSTPGGSDDTRPPSQSLYDTIVSLGLVGVVIGGILLLYGLAQRKAISQEVASGRYGRTSIVAYLVFFGLFTAITYWRFEAWEFTAQTPEEGDLVFTGEKVAPVLPERPETTYEPGFAWIPVLVVVGLAAAAIVAYLIAEHRARRSRSSNTDLGEQLAVVLDETLDDLRAEADPRRAIIAAYARLERVLAANGIPRRTSETSDEYLPRVLHGLALDTRAVERLTALFTRAKFSHHDVDAAMKEEAIDALEQVRDELRLAREQPVADAMPVGATT